ncbi:hypothetical protein [Klebsiella pneumoniae]|uniref:hypothetical protein n=1 Tax=Klebsiella pneumoniae TaxID=573 RepID=UPI001E59E37F|nr:hypothetical protein [Klebsiella pneumoniae]
MHHQSLAAEAQKVKPDAQHPRRLCAGNQQAGREQQKGDRQREAAGRGVVNQPSGGSA